MLLFKSTKFSIKQLIQLVICILLFSSCETNNWPQFRGSNFNNITDEKKLPLEWDNENNLNWIYDLEGRGWSSPIISGNQIFFTNAVLQDPSILPASRAGSRPENPTDVPYNFEVICLDIDTGKEIWKKIAYAGLPKYKTNQDNNYAPETMVTDGKRVYAYFGMTGVYCYDMKGNLIWEKDLGNYPMQSNWGTATSPVLYKDVLYMQIDNEEKSFLAALDSKTGIEKWRVDRDEKSNWGTSIIWKNSIRTELVVPGLKTRSYNPENGELIWEFETDGGRSSSSPTADSDIIVVGNEKRREGGTLYGIKAGAIDNISLKEGETSNDFVAWSVPESGIAMATPVIFDGLVYVVNRNRGEIFCCELENGNVVYARTKITDAATFWASPWINNKIIYCLDEKGITHIIQTGKEFKELGKNKLNDNFFASPAITKNSYVFRGEKGIYCIRQNSK